MISIQKNSKTARLLSIFLLTGAFVVVAYAAQLKEDTSRIQQPRPMTYDGCTPTPSPSPTPTPPEP